MFKISKKVIIVSLVIALLVLIVGVTVYLVQQQTNTQQKATQSTITPTPVSTIPACEVTQAICRWDPVSNATQYTVAITEVGSGTVVKQAVVNVPDTALEVSNKFASVSVIAPCVPSSVILGKEVILALAVTGEAPLL